LLQSEVESNYKVKETSPSYGVIYKFRPDTSIYATYIEGLEETGVAPINTTNQYQALQPAISKQKEIGFRTEAFDGITLAAGYFDIERESAHTDTATNTFVLAGLTRYRGIEYSASGEIGTDWSVYLSGLLLDPKLEKANNPAMKNNVPENTAKRTVSLFTEYRLPMVEGLSLNAGAYYIGERPVDNLNQAYISGYTLYTFGTRYVTRFDGHRATFQINVDNVTDKEYWAATGGGYLAVGSPRAVSFLVKYEL
jgi:iron complex outermembrane recepter protein